jgi:hypothetical protein
MLCETTETDSGDGGRGEPAPAARGEDKLNTVPLSSAHRMADFQCARSERVQKFFTTEWPELGPLHYCRAFVWPDPDDPTRILGYYTLSAAVIVRADLKSGDNKRMPRGIPVPVALIGFLGRDDRAQKKLGSALLYDAALRVSMIEDIGIWGLALDAENHGIEADQDKLVLWYRKMGFKSTKLDPFRMYGPLSAFVPMSDGTQA